MTDSSGDFDPAADESTPDDDPGWPFSFLLLVGAGALYLILRLVQFVADVMG